MQRALLRLAVTTADTEHSVVLPDNMGRLQVFSRTNVISRISLNPDVVEANGGTVVSRAFPYDTTFTKKTNATLYYTSQLVGTILEAHVWHDVERDLGPFDDGYSLEFG